MTGITEYCKNTIYQMVDRIRKRPAVWLGTPDINTLKTYINGYCNALMDIGIYAANSQTVLFPLDFWFMNEFAKIKTNSYESTPGWANLILQECGGNGKKALERFWEYLDEFCSLKVVSMKKALLTKENILANDNMLYSYRVGNFIDKKTPIYDSPQAVYIIELSGKNGFLCAVETTSDIQLERYIFRNDQIFGENDRFKPLEHVFGSLTPPTEVVCSENPDFNKPVH